jgi:hypothetical protein
VAGFFIILSDGALVIGGDLWSFDMALLWLLSTITNFSRYDVSRDACCITIAVFVLIGSLTLSASLNRFHIGNTLPRHFSTHIIYTRGCIAVLEYYRGPGSDMLLTI